MAKIHPPPTFSIEPKHPNIPPRWVVKTGVLFKKHGIAKAPGNEGG